MRKRFLLALPLMLTIGLAACGGSSETGSTAEAAAAPTIEAPTTTAPDPNASYWAWHDSDAFGTPIATVKTELAALGASHSGDEMAAHARSMGVAYKVLADAAPTDSPLGILAKSTFGTCSTDYAGLADSIVAGPDTIYLGGGTPETEWGSRNKTYKWNAATRTWSVDIAPATANCGAAMTQYNTSANASAAS